MKELVVISGKGGSGKTSVVASLAALAERAMVADCDVDAADLHLVLAPTVEHREDFVAGKEAEVQPELCAGCGKCVQVCRFDAITLTGPANELVDKTYRIDAIDCEGCGACARICPQEAIRFESVVCGEWFRSATRHGPMVHARLGIAQENSGKLVALVRKEAAGLGERLGLELLITDGPPGIGCPVIASVTGAALALIVAEPTVSGRHDLGRVLQLAEHFRVPAMVCINKWDLNPRVTEEIEAEMHSKNVPLAGRIRYDNSVTRAQVERLSVVEYDGAEAGEDIRAVWRRVRGALDQLG